MLTNSSRYKIFFLKISQSLDLFISEIDSIWHDNELVIIVIGPMNYCDTAACEFFARFKYSEHIRIYLFTIWSKRSEDSAIILDIVYFRNSWMSCTHLPIHFDCDYLIQELSSVIVHNLFLLYLCSQKYQNDLRDKNSVSFIIYFLFFMDLRQFVP